VIIGTLLPRGGMQQAQGSSSSSFPSSMAYGRDPRQSQGSGLLPRPNPTISYWQTPVADIADRRTTAELPEAVDFLIVGSGISGASIAYNILTREPNASVLLIEARQAASGASGRNGTFLCCHPMWIQSGRKVNERNKRKSINNKMYEY
jgi:FAD dependent oxidoreductase